jgi:hypothetical protein
MGGCERLAAERHMVNTGGLVLDINRYRLDMTCVRGQEPPIRLFSLTMAMAFDEGELGFGSTKSNSSELPILV